MQDNILIGFGGYAVFFVLGMIFMLIPVAAGTFLRPVKPSKGKGAIYECGEPTIGSSWIRYNIRFYATALDFLIFDVEVVLLLPVLVVLRQLVPLVGLGPTIAAFLAMTAFVVVLTVGLAYAWRHGTIEWVLADDKPEAPGGAELPAQRPVAEPSREAA